MERRESVNAVKVLAYNACKGTSFDPDKRGEMLLDELENELQSFLSKIPFEVKDEYEKRYIEKYSTWLCAMSRCFSSMITGAGNFNNRRHEKTNEAESNARKRLDEWAENTIKRFGKTKRLVGWDEVERLQIKHDKFVERQQIMKDTNKVLHSKKLSEVEKYDELVAIGWKESQIPELFVPDCYGYIGFESFTLKNNLAEIKRLEAQITAKTQNLEKEDTSTEYDWGTVSMCYSEERIRIVFEGVPNEDVRETLKKNGYKWSRYHGAWQRMITRNSLYNYDYFMLPYLTKTFQS